MTPNPGLLDALRKKRLILFVGAGVSQGLKLPSWSGLIAHMAEDLDYDPRIFETLGDAYTLAEYYASKMGGLGPLRRWMDTNWHPDSRDITKSKVHQLIVDLEFPIVYTTNYDRWLERSYEQRGKRFAKIKDVTDIAGAAIGVPQIVKYHGDLDDDCEIVLTESSYFARLDFQSPLDIKLKSDLLGRSVLFIGYSLTDINVRFLLYQIQQMWADTGEEDVRPRSFIFLGRPNAVVEHVFGERGITAIVNQHENMTKGLVAFLKSLRDAKAGEG